LVVVCDRNDVKVAYRGIGRIGLKYGDSHELASVLDQEHLDRITGCNC
jgi:hypothetical protein